MSFAWSKSQAEEVFVRVHQIAPKKRSAFQARLRHLQRWGVPPGTNTGKGKAAAYGPIQVTMLGVALELLQLGLSPERAALLLANSGGRWLSQMTHAGLSAVYSPEYTGGQQLMLIDPVGLGDLQVTTAAKQRIVDGGPANQLADFLADPPQPYSGHLAIIDLRWLALAICNAAAEIGLGSVEQTSWAFGQMLKDRQDDSHPKA